MQMHFGVCNLEAADSDALEGFILEITLIVSEVVGLSSEVTWCILEVAGCISEVASLI